MDPHLVKIQYGDESHDLPEYKFFNLILFCPADFILHANQAHALTYRLSLRGQHRTISMSQHLNMYPHKLLTCHDKVLSAVQIKSPLHLPACLSLR